MAARGAVRDDSIAPDGDTRGDRTRRHIRKTIARLADRKDLAEINLSDICRAAKVTTGALYFHFRSKDDAIEDMVIAEVEELYGQLVANLPDSIEDALAMLVETTTNFHQVRKKLPQAIQVTVNSRPKAYSAWIDARRPLLAKLELLIGRARAKNKLTIEHSAYLAHLVLNSLENISLDAFRWKNPTLTPFTRSIDLWNRKQSALWAWTVLAPIPTALD